MQGTLLLRAKYKSSPNIAWVKYWGKFDEDYILPINDSLGVTLNSDDINTETTITFSSQIHQDCLILNKVQQKISIRVERMFQKIKQKAFEAKYNKLLTQKQWTKYHFKVDSKNSFPTASGMASSASGLACLAAALNGLFGNILTEVELSQLARLGSGSASRSIHGGLVRWKGVPQNIVNHKSKGGPELLEKLSKQCISQTVVEHQKLKKMKILILLANNKQKQISSTSGMQTSVKTSQLINYRNGIAQKRIQLILDCLRYSDTNMMHEQEVRNFNCIVQNIIKDSNQFHAICLDTYPPIFYLNQFSKQIIYMVDHIINPIIEFKVAYTFDAGPHAFLFMHQSVQLQILHYFHQIFKLNDESFNATALEKLNKIKKQGVKQLQAKEYKGPITKPHQIWSTTIGCGTYKMEQEN